MLQAIFWHFPFVNKNLGVEESPSIIPIILIKKVTTRTKCYDPSGDVHPESGSLLHSSNLINVLPKHIAIFYLLNPMLIVNCAARTTTVWTNLCLAAALLGLTTANRGLATLAVCLAAYQSMYPIILIFPLAIHLATVKG